MLWEWTHVIDGIFGQGESTPFHCASQVVLKPESKAICAKVMIGAVWKELARIKWTRETFDTEFVSLMQQMSDWLLSIRLEGIESSWPHHIQCNPTTKVHAEIKAVLAGAPNVLTDHDRICIEN
jgi:phosphoglycerate-specific signal transduction histidine kinase